MNHIWVVEMWNLDYQRWDATVGAKLTERDARDEKKDWEANNPPDKFRIRKYIAV